MILEKKYQKEQKIILRHIMIDFIIYQSTQRCTQYLFQICVYIHDITLTYHAMLHLLYLCSIVSLIKVDIRENVYFLLRLIAYFNDSRDIARYATGDIT